MIQTLRVSLLSLVSCLGISALSVSPVLAQVNGPGPSPSSEFDIVLSLPGDEAVVGINDSIGGVEGQTTQLNVTDAGFLGFAFSANSGSEVNIDGGAVEPFFQANPGSEVNISGGLLGDFFADDSVVDISGGTFERSLFADSGSVVNISNGIILGEIFADSSTVNISGGTLQLSLIHI